MSGKGNFSAPCALLMAGLLLSACTSNGEGSGAGSSGGGTSGGGGGSITSSSSSGGPANNGTGPTSITSGGNPVTGNFICTQGATAYGDVTTQVGANGLVGDQLTALLEMLGGADATTLLNSVIDPNNVIDGNLATHATYQLAAGLFGSTTSVPIDSVDLSVVMPAGVTVPAGQFAVYGVSFPNGTVGLSLINDVTVTTFLAGNTQESHTITESALSLLGAGLSTTPPIWIGIEATKPYDTAMLSLIPTVISADVGNAMNAYEFCPGGELVNTSSSSSSSSGG